MLESESKVRPAYEKEQRVIYTDVMSKKTYPGKIIAVINQQPPVYRIMLDKQWQPGESLGNHRINNPSAIGKQIEIGNIDELQVKPLTEQ